MVKNRWWSDRSAGNQARPGATGRKGLSPEPPPTAVEGSSPSPPLISPILGRQGWGRVDGSTYQDLLCFVLD